jgi:hypothetical protein
MIESHMPFPAIVLDQNWNVIKANLSAQALLIELGYAGEENLIEALIKDEPKLSKIINWYEVVSLLLIRLRQEINLLGNPEKLILLEKELSTCISAYSDHDAINPTQTVITSKFKLSKGDYSFFSIMAQLGTVQDVAVSEYKVELMFPADEITKAFYSSSKS